MIPKIEVRDTGYTIDWKGSRYASCSWPQIVIYLKHFAAQSKRYVPVFTQATHRFNVNNKHFPILTPDGGILMATSVSDSNRIAEELNGLLDYIQYFINDETPEPY